MAGKRQRKGTGQPDPKKDRAQHDAARGKKIPTLADLLTEIPSNFSLEQFSDDLLTESDRGAAIMASALVEQALYQMLVCSLADWGEATRRAWFEGPNAPFRSFSAKIAFAHAIGITGPATTKMLNTIRNIRNVFAHRIVPLDFTNPAIVADCLTLSQNSFLPGAETPAKTRYCAVCLKLAEAFVEDSHSHGEKLIKTRFG